jgi:hypothetical protein
MQIRPYRLRWFVRGREKQVVRMPRFRQEGGSCECLLCRAADHDALHSAGHSRHGVWCERRHNVLHSRMPSRWSQGRHKMLRRSVWGSPHARPIQRRHHAVCWIVPIDHVPQSHAAERRSQNSAQSKTPSGAQVVHGHKRLSMDSAGWDQCPNGVFSVSRVKLKNFGCRKANVERGWSVVIPAARPRWSGKLVGANGRV